MDKYGVEKDDYDTFIQCRSKGIALAMNVKLLSMTPEQVLEEEMKL
jgi:hypothetical protein